MKPGTLFRVKAYRSEFDSVILGSLDDDPVAGNAVPRDEDEIELPLGEIGVVLDLHKRERCDSVESYRVLVLGKQGWLFRDEMDDTALMSEVVDEAR